MRCILHPAWQQSQGAESAVSARQTAGIALPEHTVGIALNGGVIGCHFQPLFRPGAVLLTALNGDEAAAELARRHCRRAGPGKGVEHDAAGEMCIRDRMAYIVDNVRQVVDYLRSISPVWDELETGVRPHQI